MDSTLNHVSALMDSLETNVKPILMILLETDALMVEPVKMESIHTHVIVQMVLLETVVKQILIIVKEKVK